MKEMGFGCPQLLLLTRQLRTTKAHGYCSTPPLPPPVADADHASTTQPYRSGDADHDWPCHHDWHRSLIEKGASYRTLQRFFATLIPWPHIFWLFFSQHHLQPDDVYILAGDETVVSKAGKHTFGLDRFFSGISQRVVPSVAFFSFALISTITRRTYPLRLDQVVRTPVEKAASKAKAVAKEFK